jgi:hypothetical protein
MRPVIVTIAVVAIASAQSPDMLRLEGVWILDAARSQTGPESLPRPVVMSLIPNRSEVHVIQIAEAQHSRSFAVYDYTLEPARLSDSSYDRNFSKTLIAFRAHNTDDRTRAPDEKWCLSGDWLRLKIQRSSSSRPNTEKQILYFGRSKKVSLQVSLLGQYTNSNEDPRVGTSQGRS